MQRVASARLSRDRRTIGNSQLYTKELIRLVWQVSAATPMTASPLLRPGSTSKPACVVVFGSDRGLCGAFNAALVSELQTFVAKRGESEVALWVMGRIVERRARRLGLTVERSFAQPSAAGRRGRMREIAQASISSFVDRRIREVYLLYSWFRAGLRHDPVLERILPAPFSTGNAERGATTFEPDAETVLSDLLPEFVHASMDHAFLNSIGAENAARQRAMSRAARNAQDMLSELTRSYRRLRQEDITTEMMELARGGDT